MSYHGSDFYDNDTNFENYMERRQRQENPNDTLEKPVISELIGEVAGLKILDLGCGDARLAKELFEKHSVEYTGIEGSNNMVKTASKSLEGLNGQVIQTTMEQWEPPQDTFHLALSRLAIHYVQDINRLFKKVHHALKPDGRFVFSVEHPVITSTLQPSGVRTNWIVDNYFIEGYREQQWLGGTVYKYHRSIEQYFGALQEAGFTVEHLRESAPERHHFINDETYERRLRIPLFLFFGARKRLGP